MLTLNGKKFARNDSEFVESLFHPGGTCVGYYKATSRQIFLMDHQKERIGVINPSGVLGRATRREDGRYWYSYADIPQVGRYDSYMRQVEECAAALREHCHKPRNSR
jgi:hypothetical protein